MKSAATLLLPPRLASLSFQEKNEIVKPVATVLPTASEVSELLQNVEEVIGLSASCPQHSRYKISPLPSDAQCYQLLWSTIDDSLRRFRDAGFPLFHPNPHRTLQPMWAWCWTMPGGAKERMARPRELYAEVIRELQALRDAVSRGVDASAEALRELRESVHRNNELFVIMAFRTETDGFWQQVVQPAANSLSLKAVRIDKEETAVAISEEILSSIRRALLVLCDLSFERPNCYYEAGYAKGCFRRVLFTARRDHDPRAQPAGPFKVHFDLDQLKITWWDPDDLPKASGEVEERIRKILTEIQER